MKIKYDLKIPASNKTDKQEEGNKSIKLKKNTEAQIFLN